MESTVSHILGYGGTTVSLDELRTCSTNVLLELSDELLTASSEELLGVSEEELARFSEELLGVCTDEEESASMASLLRRSWLSGISATEELDVYFWTLGSVAAVRIVVVWFDWACNLTAFGIA